MREEEITSMEMKKESKEGSGGKKVDEIGEEPFFAKYIRMESGEMKGR